MLRHLLAPVIASAACLMFATCAIAQEPAAPEPPATQPPEAQAPEAQPPAPPRPEPVELIEATKEEIWTLGGKTWDFKDVSTTYKPVKGLLNPSTGIVQWTLEIVREMSEGEIGMHGNLEETPFKPAFLDAERVVLEEDAPSRMSKIGGKVGDRVLVGFKLPEPDVLEKTTLVRVGKRTNVGF